jgi:hypothetical protein
VGNRNLTYKNGSLSSSSLGSGGTYASNEAKGQKGHQVQTYEKEQYEEEESGEKDQKEVTT